MRPLRLPDGRHQNRTPKPRPQRRNGKRAQQPLGTAPLIGHALSAARSCSKVAGGPSPKWAHLIRPRRPPLRQHFSNGDEGCLAVSDVAGDGKSARSAEGGSCPLREAIHVDAG